MTTMQAAQGRVYRWTAVTAMLALAGCAPKYKDLKSFVQAHRGEVAATSYRVEPPDVIQIESPTAPEIHGETQRIRSDGKISLRLIGEVQVNGQTPTEIAAKLEGLLAEYYEEPKVSVRVAAYESKNVYAFGQVGGRGAHPFTGRDTVLDLMAEAQPNFIAWGSQVKIIRPNADPNERHEIVVDVDKMMESGDLTNNFLLQEGDIVYVPPTPLGWVGLRIQELLFPVSPVMSAYQTPSNFRNATDDYQHGGQYGDRDENSNNRRQLLWMR